jgi:hypothetical protein
MQGTEAELHEHRRTYYVSTCSKIQCTDFLIRRLKTKQIIKEKDRFVQNLQGALEKE